MHEATFRLSGSDGYAGLTADHDARVALWCHDRCDLLRIRCSDDAVDAVLERVAAVAGVDDALVENGDVLAITDRCVDACDERTVDAVLDEHGCLLVPPLRYEDGHRLCRVLAFDDGRLTACYRDLLEAFDVTVDAKRRIESVSSGDRPIPLEATLPSLTRRQRQAFTAAFDDGYYELPRETTMEAVAERLGIDRRTAEEHRRRAERKLLGALLDRYLA